MWDHVAVANLLAILVIADNLQQGTEGLPAQFEGIDIDVGLNVDFGFRTESKVMIGIRSQLAFIEIGEGPFGHHGIGGHDGINGLLGQFFHDLVAAVFQEETR
jgi:hypothetical protein